MSNQNESQSAALGMAVIGIILMAAFALVYAALVLLSLFVTGMAIRTFRHPIVVFGRTYTEDEGRAYLKRGLIGTVTLPIIVIFASAILGTRFNPDYFWMLPVGGYAFGSLVVGYWIEQAKQKAGEQQAAMPVLLPPEQTPSDRTITARPSVTPVPDAQPEPAPFRFATWDDEEELRK